MSHTRLLFVVLLTILVLLLLTQCTRARAADDVPVYNPHAYCGDVQKPSKVIYDQCISEESKGYVILKLRWDDIPKVIRDYCIQMTSFGPGTYWGLLGCIQAELDAQGERT